MLKNGNDEKGGLIITGIMDTNTIIKGRKKFKEGWDAEKLAEFLLSKFSFISSPIKISDDIGTDFFCTIFKIENENLNPYNTFAIQIKKKPKDNKNIDITNKWEYLNGIEIPYLLGLVDLENLKIEIFSGEELIYLQSIEGKRKKLEIKLIEKLEKNNNTMHYKNEEERYIIDFPKITEVGVGFKYENNIEEIN